MVSLLLHAIILAMPNLNFEKKVIANDNSVVRATLRQSPNVSERQNPESQEVKLEKQKKSPVYKGISRSFKQSVDALTPQSFLPDPPQREIVGSSIDSANDTKNQTKTNLLVHFPGSILDRPPVPYTAPNPREYLTGTSIPTLPIKLRLYIDVNGKVIQIEAKRLEYLDESIITPVKDMFYATTFIPGNIKGIDVPSYIDIDVELSEFIE